MATNDLPAMSTNSRESYHYSPGMAIGSTGASIPSYSVPTAGDVLGLRSESIRAARRLSPAVAEADDDSIRLFTEQQKERAEAMANSERVVQIYVADLDQNLPLDKRLIWQSEPTFTDLKDDEVWFDLASTITAKLAEHNKYRLTVRNKAIKDREVMLEEIRPRDLSVNFTNLAQFQKPNK